jgi:predicted HicB family RNase H-like nuclease
VEKIKAFNIRIPREMWSFLKMQSVVQERSMNLIVLECLNKYKKNIEKMLTSSNTMVS